MKKILTILTCLAFSSQSMMKNSSNLYAIETQTGLSFGQIESIFRHMPKLSRSEDSTKKIENLTEELLKMPRKTETAQTLTFVRETYRWLCEITCDLKGINGNADFLESASTIVSKFDRILSNGKPSYSEVFDENYLEKVEEFSIYLNHLAQ